MSRLSTTTTPRMSSSSSGHSPTYLPSSPASSSSLSSSSFSGSTFNNYRGGSSPLHSPFSPFSPTTTSLFSPTAFNNNNNNGNFSTPQSAATNNGTSSSSSRRFYTSTYSEFAADCGPPPRSPAHPLQSSRSSLAVARSHHSTSGFRQQSSSEDVDATTGSNNTSFLQKSYSQQIDEVMEQLNANCELSAEESSLFFGSPPKSAVSLSSSSVSTSQGSSSATPKAEGLKKNPSAAAGLTKKSNSTSQLSVSGTKKRLGFRKKQTTSFSVHRSEEVLPEELLRQQQLSSVSSDGDGPCSGNSSIDWMPPLSPYGRASAGSAVAAASVFDEEDDRMSTFVEGLGPGQIISRQAVASSSMGEIQLSLKSIKAAKTLEVEIVRARGLCVKGGARVLPATYVKVYLLRNRKVIAKCKTATATRRTLDPLFQQVLQFPLNYSGCSIHVIVWGDYSRMEKKVFMGVVQIVLDELDLSSTVMSWYKLFDSSSSVMASSSCSGSTAIGRSTAILSNKHFGGSMSASMECFLGEHK